MLTDGNKNLKQTHIKNNSRLGRKNTKLSDQIKIKAKAIMSENGWGAVGRDWQNVV